MERTHEQEPGTAERGADLEPMSGTVSFRTGSAESYGRHAAPPSAYGPADVHRLPPVSRTRLRVAEQVEAADRAEEDTAAATPARTEREAAVSSSGFWARLRLLPKVA
ncbi:hypothetical protein SAMN04515665_11639 [Blastococcus sp. DSM 46786]|uniref:hypothetical protein n=1 Tax=Blastococcus sp. DSM 46786 TaxID=1798227 RepID=UPI0008D3AAEB|nr:hypothetical protein [Blastococcus sp. DSM 46786]SEL64643.1 hypothetical protein SAMN04515665_11639 [Blastococcus sp. DSM 46786]